MLDSKTLDRLWSTHSHAVFGFVLSLTRQRPAAEEILQETFLKAMKSMPPSILLESESAARGWLIRVSKNVFIDRYRKLHRELHGGNNHLSGVVLESLDSVLDAIVVKEALCKLSREHQDVIKYCILQQLSVADTAIVVGVPAGTVKSRTYYALRALRLQLEEMGFGQWMIMKD